MSSLEFFSCFYRIRGVDKRVSFFTQQRLLGASKLLVDLLNKIDDFETDWFVVKALANWSAPLQWCWDDE